MNIEHLTHEAVSLLESLIATPSVSREEKESADVLAHFIEEKGIPYERHGNNLVCKGPEWDDARPTLLLNAHIDTVKPASGWTRPPFEPTREGERIYGLGSNDDGASVVSLLQTFRILSGRPQPYNLLFVASAEEEVSGANGLESLIPLLPPIDLALVGEPTSMQPAIAEKGLLVLDITARGKAGHAARNEGVNAIYQALPDINWFRTFRFAQASDLLGPVKMSVTMIQSGTQHNVVPDCCTFTVDIRSNEFYSNEDIYNEVCCHVQSEVRARSFRLNSSRIDPNHPLVQRAVAAGRAPFGSPTLSDQALMPWTSLKMGPGCSSRSHTADEYIEIGEIREAIELYVKLLDGLVL